MDDERVEFDQTSQSTALQRIGLVGLLGFAAAVCLYAALNKFLA